MDREDALMGWLDGIADTVGLERMMAFKDVLLSACERNDALAQSPFSQDGALWLYSTGYTHGLLDALIVLFREEGAQTLIRALDARLDEIAQGYMEARDVAKQD